MDMRRRRSMSKGEPTADERPDALLEEARASETTKEPTRRAQSLEPSRRLTPSLRKTSSTLAAGASRERSAPEGVPTLPTAYWDTTSSRTWTPWWRTSRRARRWWWGNELAAAGSGTSLGDVGWLGNASSWDVGRERKPIANADLARAT